MIRVVGIGSPFGDDAAGLEAARALAEAPPAGCEVLVEDRPGVLLVDLVASAEAAIVIDAVRSGAPPGTVHDLPLAGVRGFDARVVSSHDLGVGAALALAQELGRMPARGRFIGVEAGTSGPEDLGTMSAAVREAIPELVERARAWVARMRGERRGLIRRRRRRRNEERRSGSGRSE
jgi:hydrogenase maturation protease